MTSSKLYEKQQMLCAGIATQTAEYEKANERQRERKILDS